MEKEKIKNEFEKSYLDKICEWKAFYNNHNRNGIEFCIEQAKKDISSIEDYNRGYLSALVDLKAIDFLDYTDLLILNTNMYIDYTREKIGEIIGAVDELPNTQKH